jgi:hypothetical protein
MKDKAMIIPQDLERGDICVARETNEGLMALRIEDPLWFCWNGCFSLI